MRYVAGTFMVFFVTSHFWMLVFSVVPTCLWWEWASRRSAKRIAVLRLRLGFDVYDWQRHGL